MMHGQANIKFTNSNIYIAKRLFYMAYLNNNTGILKEICNGRAVKLPQRCGRVLPSYEVAILWRRSVVVYRRFGTTYRSDIQGETSCLKTSVTGYQSIPLTHPRREKAPG